MQKAANLQQLSATAVEALKLALYECQQSTTGGFILAALAVVTQIQEELDSKSQSGCCGDLSEMCAPI